jgi:hypothetical protein
VFDLFAFLSFGSLDSRLFGNIQDARSSGLSIKYIIDICLVIYLLYFRHQHETRNRKKSSVGKYYGRKGELFVVSLNFENAA